MRDAHTGNGTFMYIQNFTLMGIKEHSTVQHTICMILLLIFAGFVGLQCFETN